MLGFYLALIDEPSDREKFSEIYASYKNMMFGVAMSVLHNEALASEAVQDCLLKIAEIIGDIPPVKNNQQLLPESGKSRKLKAFLIITARNKAINKLRAEHYENLEPLGENEPVSDNALNGIMSEIGYKRLVDEVGKLDSIYRDALTYRLVYEYSTEEISDLLGLPMRTVETRIYRGRKLLRERLEAIFDEN